MTYEINVTTIKTRKQHVEVKVFDGDVLVKESNYNILTNDVEVARSHAEDIYLADMRRNHPDELAGLTLPCDIIPEPIVEEVVEVIEEFEQLEGDN